MERWRTSRSLLTLQSKPFIVSINPTKTYNECKNSFKIKTCNKAAKTHGQVDLKLFRSPFGVANPNIKKALGRTQMQPIGWSLRSFDALFSSEEFLYKNIIKQLKKGDVVLLHDNQAHTLIILERLLVFLQQHNFKSVTIDELFHIKAYA